MSPHFAEVFKILNNTKNHVYPWLLKDIFNPIYKETCAA